MMESHRYIMFNGPWGISITIIGQVFDKDLFDEDCMSVCNGIWLSFDKSPLVENEIFCEEDKKSIYNAVCMVPDNILKNSIFKDKTVIQICSLQYNPCFYQEDAMVIAMIFWCSNVFMFEYKEIESRFDYFNNRYIFKL